MANTIDQVAKSVVDRSGRQLPKAVMLKDLPDIATFARAMLENVRENMTAPHPRKIAPTYSLAQLAALCSMDKPQANHIVTTNHTRICIGRIDTV